MVKNKICGKELKACLRENYYPNLSLVQNFKLLQMKQTNLYLIKVPKLTEMLLDYQANTESMQNNKL